MTSNMDVILEIQSQVKDMKTKIVFTHVESHQDEHVPIKELPIRAQLNSKMDKIAEKQYNFSINEHYKKMPHLPAQQISFSSPWHRLTNNMESEFSRSRRDFIGEKEALRGWNIKETLAADVDWTSLEQSIRKWPKYGRGTPIKCLHDLWDTTKRKKDWQQTDSDTCPLCNVKVESTSHVLRCTHLLMVAARNSEIEGLNRKFKAANTDPKLRRWLMVVIRQWLQEFRVATPQRMRGYKKIRRAVLSQMEIGIRNMFKGILSSKWKRAHERTLKKKYGHFVSGDSWASTISHALLQMSIRMWNTRCQIVHAN